jgi:hypothetical protein
MDKDKPYSGGCKASIGDGLPTSFNRRHRRGMSKSVGCRPHAFLFDCSFERTKLHLHVSQSAPLLESSMLLLQSETLSANNIACSSLLLSSRHFESRLSLMRRSSELPRLSKNKESRGNICARLGISKVHMQTFISWVSLANLMGYGHICVSNPTLERYEELEFQRSSDIEVVLVHLVC